MAPVTTKLLPLNIITIIRSPQIVQVIIEVDYPKGYSARFPLADLSIEVRAFCTKHGLGMSREVLEVY